MGAYTLPREAFNLLAEAFGEPKKAEIFAKAMELQKFENTYHMPSQEFFKKFASGVLPHETDYFEWFAYLDMSKKIVEKIRNLERELGETLCC